MIPGTLCDGRVFVAQRRALRGVADVRVVDFRQMHDARLWVQQLLRALPARFSVIGFSLGGLLALELLRAAPERIERLAMVASNAQAGSRRGRRNSATLWRLWRSAGPLGALRHARAGYFHGERHRQRHAALLQDMALRTPRAAARAAFDWAAERPQGLDIVSRFRGPLLVVSGAKDPKCPPAWQRALVQAQPAATWLELPRVGHFVSLEAPARLNHQLVRWMQTPVTAAPPPPPFHD